MAENAKNLTWLDGIDPVRMVDDEKVKNQFIDTYSKIHKVSIEDAEVVYNKESIYYKQALSGSDKLKSCTKISLYSTWLEIAIIGTSIQPGSKSLAYLESRSTQRPDKSWISTCRLVLSAYGELEARIKSGQILVMLNPIVVYDGDHFQPRTNDRGEVYVDYAALIPRKKDAKIIGSWVRMIVPGNVSDFKWLTVDDIERLKKCSVPKTGDVRNPNALYSSVNGGIDPGFLEAKTIKHAMRSKGKLKVSATVALEGDDDEEETTNTPSFAAPAPEANTVQIVTNPDEAF